MSRIRYNASSSWAIGTKRGETMREPEEVAAMLRLHALGWGAKRIAAELGVVIPHADSRFTGRPA